ncbi:MAG: peroxidase-related enzyme [Bacteroidales bacterium]
MPRISVKDYENAEGRLRDIYEEIIEKRGKLANIHTIQSLRPESIKKHMDLYMEIMFTSSPLKRWQREMMAVVVSNANKCLYCTLHHLEPLKHYIKDTDITDRIVNYPEKPLDDPKNEALCHFAYTLTKSPGDHSKKDFTQKLKENGFSDQAILDAVLVVSYFNFVNRIVLSLDLQPSDKEITGYKY